MTEIKIVKGKVKTPWAVIVYGPPGIGKTYWATHAPKPLFIDMELGSTQYECDRILDPNDENRPITKYADLIAAIQTAAASDYKTIVFDTADALEKILSQHVCETHQKESLADFGYGKGEVHLRAEWTKIINVVLRLKAKGKNVIFTAHEQIQKLDDPTTESYDRFTLNLDKKATPAITAAMDAVLFARYETVVKERDDKSNKMRAIGTGKRVLHALESPAFVAKNRMGLPAIVPMTTALFAKFDEQGAE